MVPSIDTKALAPRSGVPDLLDLLSGGEPPAFANDQNHRIIFWNKGAERVMERTAAQTLGRFCHEIFCGRDPFGNRFCDEGCAVSRSLVRQETISRFEITTADKAHSKSLGFTVIGIPDSRPGYFTAVHILDEVDESSRLAREIARLRRAQGSATLAPRPLNGYDAMAVQPRRGVLPANAPAAKEDRLGEALSPREMDVLRAIAAGQANKEIASTLHISVATTRNHVQRILRKLNVHSKLEAVALAFRQGWN